MATITQIQTVTKNSSVVDDVNESVRGRLAGSSYSLIFNDVSWQFDDGVLMLYGCMYCIN